MHSNQPLLSYWCGQMFTRSDSVANVFGKLSHNHNNNNNNNNNNSGLLLCFPMMKCLLSKACITALTLRLAPLQVSLTRADHGKPIVC